MGVVSIYGKTELGLSLLLRLLHLVYHGFQLYLVLLCVHNGVDLSVFLNVISAFSLGVLFHLCLEKGFLTLYLVLFIE